MAFVQNVPVRFDDVDYARIVYYPKLFSYCHWVFEDFFQKELGIPYSEMLIKRRVGFPTVSAEADFKSPLRFGDTCRVVMKTRYLGRRSITSAYRLELAGSGTVCAELEIVTVCIEMESFRSVDMPEDVRNAFSRHLP
jgi:4-hydroxybenzoyl-CoA thioesterase